MPNLIKAEYHGNVVTFTDDAWFNASEVAEKFGKQPTDWLTLESTKEYLSSLSEILNCEKSSLLKTKKGRYPSGTWLHPKLGIPFARWLDMRFSIWCELQIETLLKGTHTYHDWKKLRHEATASYKVMSQILQLTRQRQGKTCSSHHYSTEANLINWALSGKFEKLDRNLLGSDDLNLLAKLENKDSVLIACGSSYEDRKKELKQFADKQRIIR